MPEPITWHNLATARAAWRDAPKSDPVLQDLLDTAQHECETFAPALAADATTIPIGYRTAHLLQARAIWTFLQANPNEEIGLEGAGGVRLYPMDANVRQRLRPKRGRPGIG